MKSDTYAQINGRRMTLPMSAAAMTTHMIASCQGANNRLTSTVTR